jgi:ubiquinone biosynthesis protein COQ9
MRRIDVFQAHRAGVLALFRALPFEPPMAVLLACATRRSMRWLLQAAEVDTSSLRGELTARGLVAVWLWTLRAWVRDESVDLSATMAALDTALRRADRAAQWLRGTAPAAAPAPEAPAADAQATDTEAPPENR